MFRFFKTLEHNGNGSYSNDVATMKVIKKGEDTIVVPLIKQLTGRDPDLEIDFKKSKQTGFVWYKEK